MFSFKGNNTLLLYIENVCFIIGGHFNAVMFTFKEKKIHLFYRKFLFFISYQFEDIYAHVRAMCLNTWKNLLYTFGNTDYIKIINDKVFFSLHIACRVLRNIFFVTM